MGRRPDQPLIPNPRGDLREESVVLRFRFEITCITSAQKAMRHYMEVARRCYEQGRGVTAVKLVELDS